MRTHKTISLRVTGYRKQMEGKPCEDATRVIRLKNATIMAVADGHGDHRCIFAHIGSQLAVKATCEVLKLYSKKMKDEDPSVYWNSRRTEIAQSIVKAFYCLVISDYASRCKENIILTELQTLSSFIDDLYMHEKEVCTPDQIRQRYTQRKKMGDQLQSILYLYGTTVRASLITNRYMFHTALGDGDTMILIDDRIEWLLPKAEAYECETASLCEAPQEVVENFVFSYMELNNNELNRKLESTCIWPQMLLLSTDGLGNSFYSEHMFFDKIKDVYKCVIRDRAKASCDLKTLFAKLSRESVYQDDISCAILWQ